VTGRPQLRRVVNGGSSGGDGIAVMAGEAMLGDDGEERAGDAAPVVPPPLQAVSTQNATRAAARILRSTPHPQSARAFVGRQRRR
jgi:hypothetical protein